MNLIEKLGRIDRRVIYAGLILSLLLPLVRPLGLPVSVGSHAKKTFAAIDALQEGDTILVDIGYSVSGAADVQPQAIAILKHLFGKGVKMIFVANQPDGSMVTEALVKPYEEAGKQSGVDFVNLGYLAGGENAMALYCQDIKKAYPSDYRRVPTADMPILQGVTGVKDLKMFIFFTTQNSDMYVRQASPYGVKLIGGLINTIAPQAEPYVNAGQLTGILVGLRGGAEYEMLMKAPGTAVASMDAQSMGHLLIIAFVLLGNLSYFLTRNKTEKGGSR